MSKSISFFNKSLRIARFKISLASLFWFALSLIAVFIQIKKNSFNNYLIYKGVFWHSLHEVNLYSLYPNEYFDCNHYGIVFSIIIAPFALLPDVLGCILWGLANTISLFLAIQMLPVEKNKKMLIQWVAVIEMMTSMHNLQFNPMLTSYLLFSWILVIKKKDFWATLFIALGIMTKIYGVVALSFFLFSSDRLKFVYSFIFWTILLFCIPMLFVSPSFNIQSYQDWYYSLYYKNQSNVESTMQGMNVMRLIKRGFNLPQLSDSYFFILGFLGAIGILFKPTNWKNENTQFRYLSLMLISIVIFSSSAESSTFIIAMTGVAIWFVQEKNSHWLTTTILISAIVLTSISTTDFFPQYAKVNIIRPYAIKALPCMIVWIIISLQILFPNILKKKIAHE